MSHVPTERRRNSPQFARFSVQKRGLLRCAAPNERRSVRGRRRNRRVSYPAHTINVKCTNQVYVCHVQSDRFDRGPDNESSACLDDVRLEVSKNENYDLGDGVLSVRKSVVYDWRMATKRNESRRGGESGERIINGNGNRSRDDL